MAHDDDTWPMLDHYSFDLDRDARFEYEWDAMIAEWLDDDERSDDGTRD